MNLSWLKYVAIGMVLGLVLLKANASVAILRVLIPLLALAVIIGAIKKAWKAKSGVGRVSDSSTDRVTIEICPDCGKELGSCPECPHRKYR